MTIAPALANDTPTQIASELAAIALELQRCTVQVRSRRTNSGSGVIWHFDGLIITNAHVVPDERVTVELADGRVLDAVRTSIDPKRDLATLQVEATDLPTVTVGNSDTLRVGELVLAIGNPLGVVGALTTGIIHGIDSSETPLSQRWVMADVRLAPGNSGGALANARGQVIGINTMIAGGLALAVPSNQVEHFLKNGSRPYLGVTLRPVEILLDNKQILGLVVLEVAQNSPAIAAGLMVGDVLIGACGQWFNSPEDLLNIVAHTETREVLPLEFLRKGKRSYCSVVLCGNSNIADTSLAGVKPPCSR